MDKTMRSIKKLAELFRQAPGGFGDIAGCEFCQAAPMKWVVVGNVVVFVCETHLDEFLREVATLEAESPGPMLFKSDRGKSGDPF